VKQEKLAFLADNPFYTKRFAVYVGKRCSTSTIKDVAKELHLDRKTVKELEKHYLREKLRRAGTPKPNVIGIDELSIRKGHTYRIVVSDLERKRPIWFGGADRKEESLNLFYQQLGAAKTKRIRLAVMDMWKPFENSTCQNAPQAAILYDKFISYGTSTRRWTRLERANMPGSPARIVGLLKDNNTRFSRTVRILRLREGML